MAPHIIAAAARYGVPPEAIAGSLAVEQFDQKASLENWFKAVGSSVVANKFLSQIYKDGSETNPLNPMRGASDIVLGKYNANPNAITVGPDFSVKVHNPLLVDYGPAGVKFHNAIQAILNNPDDPGFAPYVNNVYSAGDALQKGSDPSLTTSAMAAYLQQAIRVYQANMSVNGDPQTVSMPGTI